MFFGHQQRFLLTFFDCQQWPKLGKTNYQHFFNKHIRQFLSFFFFFSLSVSFFFFTKAKKQQIRKNQRSMFSLESTHGGWFSSQMDVSRCLWTCVANSGTRNLKLWLTNEKPWNAMRKESTKYWISLPKHEDPFKRF